MKKRVPKVVEMGSSFIQNIVTSNEFNIKLSSVYLMGYCLGGQKKILIKISTKLIIDNNFRSHSWKCCKEFERNE